MRLYIGVGIVGCLVTLWIFTRIMRYAVENARWDIIAGAAVMAVYGIAELYITYIHWNFYLIVFAAIPVLRPHDLRLGEKGWIRRLILGTDSPNR
jgi:membrane protein YdbS with pleckstrin-like domain